MDTFRPVPNGVVMTDSGDASTADDPGRRSKVERVCRAYGLDGKGAELARRWRGEDGERESLRSLARAFNEDVLRAALRDAGERPLDGEAGNLYRLLTGDDVGSGQRAEVEARLQREGLDPDDLRSDFVSHQAVHTYLRKHRGVEPPGSDEADGDRAERTKGTIERTRGRLEEVTAGSVADLSRRGEVTVGDVDVLVSVQVYCEDCGRQFDASALIERGGCDCESE